MRAILLLLTFTGAAFAETKTLEVGPGKDSERIEDAYARAKPGDTILVHPLPDGAAYAKVAVAVQKARLSFRAAGGGRVRISGEGFDYSGRGPVPRAIFEFRRGADGCLLEGFELYGGRNQDFNGAGVRINQANDVTVRNCEIHDCDMGVMSNGDRTLEAARNQRFESCMVHGNGNDKHRGKSHNFYVAGTSITLSGCGIHSSTTGHNVKSRAHFTRIEYCFIHHAAEREIDLVDGKETSFPGSDAVLVGNIIVKHPRCPGNQNVIHFGGEGGGPRDGTLYLVHNTIVTPFRTVVLDLSRQKAKAYLANNLLWNGGAGAMHLFRAWKGANPDDVTGSHNWAPRGLSDAGRVGFDTGSRPPLGDDYRLTESVRGIVDAGLDWKEIDLPATPGAEAGPQPFRQYRHPAGSEERPQVGAPDVGAYEFVPRDG